MLIVVHLVSRLKSGTGRGQKILGDLVKVGLFRPSILKALSTVMGMIWPQVFSFSVPRESTE